MLAWRCQASAAHRRSHGHDVCADRMQDGSIMLAFGRRYGLIGRNGAPHLHPSASRCPACEDCRSRLGAAHGPPPLLKRGARAGTGKTTFLRALATRQIKGIPANCQILHVEQEARPALAAEAGQAGRQSSVASAAGRLAGSATSPPATCRQQHRTDTRRHDCLCPRHCALPARTLASFGMLFCHSHDVVTSLLGLYRPRNEQPAARARR